MTNYDRDLDTQISRVINAILKTGGVISPLNSSVAWGAVNAAQDELGMHLIARRVRPRRGKASTEPMYEVYRPKPNLGRDREYLQLKARADRARMW